MRCPKCGAELPNGSRFCGHCGASIDSRKPAPKKKKSKLPLIIAILLVVGILAAGLLIVHNKNKTVPDDRVLGDMAAFFEDALPEMSLTSTEITGRFTDPRNHIDQVNLLAVGENEACQVDYEMVMEYYRTDGEWHLQRADYGPDPQVTLLRSTVTEDMALERLEIVDDYRDYEWASVTLTDRQTDLVNGMDVFLYDLVYQQNYAEFHFLGTVTYRFDRDELAWETYRGTIENGHYTWKPSGPWVLYSNEAHVRVEILSAEENTFEIKFEADHFDDDQKRWTVSGGPFTYTGERKKNVPDELVFHVSLNDAAPEQFAGYMDICTNSVPTWQGIPMVPEAEFEISDDQGTPLRHILAVSNTEPYLLTEETNGAAPGDYELHCFQGWLGKIKPKMDFCLDGKYTTFTADCFVGPGMGEYDACDFTVYCDGEAVLTRTGLNADSDPETLKIDVTGVNQLTIELLAAEVEEGHDGGGNVYLTKPYLK